MATVDKSTDVTRLENVDYGERPAGNWVCRNFTYADFAASADVLKLIVAPANSFVRNLVLIVTTAFDAGTTNKLDVGDGGDPNGYLIETEVDEGNASINDFHAANNTAAYALVSKVPRYATADTIDVVYTFTGTAPTAGVGLLMVELVTIPGGI